MGDLKRIQSNPNLAVRPKKGKVQFMLQEPPVPTVKEVIAPVPGTLANSRRSCTMTGFVTNISVPNESQIEIQVTTKLNQAFLTRRSKSAVDLRAASVFRFQNFQAFQQHELHVGAVFKSMEDVRGRKDKDMSQTQLFMENTIVHYLRQKNFPTCNHNLDLLVTGDDFFNIFSFLAHLPEAKQFPSLRSVPRWQFSKSVERRPQIIEAAIYVDYELFPAKKILRKGYLLNPVAPYSRPRVITFLYNIIRRLVQGPQDQSTAPRQTTYSFF